MWEKGILLTFVETMNFINKKNGAFVFCFSELFCLCNDFPDLFHTGKDGRKIDKVSRSRTRQYSGKSGFSGSWWPPEDKRRKFAGFQDAFQEFSFSQQFLLTNEFL